MFQSTKHHPLPLFWNIPLVLTLFISLLCSPQLLAQGKHVNASGITSIHDIQYTTDPSGDSPLTGQSVKIRGVVTAIYYYGFVVADEGGPWNAIYVYTRAVGPSIGDMVQFVGEVQEYSGMTELTNVSDYHLLGVAKFDRIMPWPLLLQDSQQEAYEAVLVKFEDVRVMAFTNYGEWIITDNIAGIRCAYMDDYNYFPQVGDELDAVTGIIYYYYGQNALMPRMTNDMEGALIPHYALHGSIVTMDHASKIMPGGYVEILGDRIVGVTNDPPPSCDMVFTVEGYIFPGLIDAHNHPFWNAFDKIPFPAADKPYDNRYEWQASQTYADFSAQYNSFMSYHSPVVPPGTNAEKYSELRVLCAGTTTIQGSNCNGTYNEDYALQGVGINNAERFPARIYDIVKPLPINPGQIATLQAQYWKRFLLHLCEGTDNASLDEFYAVKNAGILDDRITIIHGVPLTSTEFAFMAEADAHLVWSPSSNVELYDATANIPAALDAGVNVALAPDWTPSGEFNVLDELRFAKSWSASHWSNGITAEQFAQFVTVNAAYALGLEHRIGSIEAGKQADLMVIPALTSNPYDDLLATHEKDVMLTVVGGRPMYGNPSLMQSFPFVSNLEDLLICGTSKKVAWTVDSKFAWYSDQPVSLMLAEIMDAYAYATPKIAGLLHYDKCTAIPKRGTAPHVQPPMQLALNQNYPNPFNPETTIDYALPADGQTSIVVFDALGREVQTLVDEYQSAGLHAVHFDARNLPGGMYLCSMTAAGTRLTRWMTLVK